MMNWMIVDDEPVFANMLSMMIRLIFEDPKTITFSDGSEAIAYIDRIDAGQVADEDIPDIIISDLMMPLVNGDLVAERAQSSPRLGETPRMIFTAYAVPKNLRFLAELVEQGILSTYLGKPFLAEDFLKAVYPFLENPTLTRKGRSYLES